MTDKKHCTFRLPRDILGRLREEAGRKNTSSSNVITEILKEHYDRMNHSDTPQTVSSVAAVYMNLDSKKKLARKAHQANLSVPEYIRYLMEPKQMFNLNIVVNDLVDWIDTIQSLIRTFNAVAKVILQTNRAYDVQVKELLRVADEILTLCGRIYTLEYSQRVELLSAATKRINAEIDRFRESEKRALRRKNTKTGEDESADTVQVLP